MNEKQIDLQYKSFPPFSEWAELSVGENRWQRIGRLLEARDGVESQDIKRAQKIVRGMAAVETGAIEGLYETDRGFTYTIALEAATVEAAWQVKAAEKGEDVVRHIGDQLAAYEHILDFATGETPIAATWIRELHAVICASQERYLVHTPQGPQQQILPKGEYKSQPNHVTQPDDTIHAYAPVDMTSNEMLRLCDEVNSDEFLLAHPVMQAAYVHYAFVVVHPFADGNGRVSRALASIYSYREMSIPVLILSDDRRDYYRVLALADEGDYQPFNDFILFRFEHSAELVSDTLKAATTIETEELRSQFEGLYTTAGGYSHDQVDKAAKELMQKLEEFLNQELPTISSQHLSLDVGRVGGGGHIPPGMRAPVSNPQITRISIASDAPAHTRRSFEVSVGVPVDAQREDEVVVQVSGMESPTEFNARLTDLLPTLNSVVQIRLSIFAKRVIRAGFELVVRDASQQIDR